MVVSAGWCPVPALLLVERQELGKDDSDRTLPLRTVGTPVLVASAVPGAPPSGLETPGADVFPPRSPERLHCLLVGVVGFTGHVPPESGIRRGTANGARRETPPSSSLTYACC